MVSKSFDINSASLQPFDSASKRLILELSADTVTVILTNRQTGEPEAVESFRGGHRTVEDWQAMLQQSRLLSITDLETLVITGYLNMIPVPASLYQPQLASAQMELFFGSAEALFTSGDVLKSAEMVLAWQIPLQEHDFLVNHFQWIQTRHVVSLLLEAYERLTDADGHISVYGNSAWIVLWIQGEFYIAKPVLFSRPEDLSWNLLDLCRHCNLSATSVQWTVSGMVEEGSTLWQAIDKFVDPVMPMQSATLLQEVPAHYFAHLVKALQHS